VNPVPVVLGLTCSLALPRPLRSSVVDPQTAFPGAVGFGAATPGRRGLAGKGKIIGREQQAGGCLRRGIRPRNAHIFSVVLIPNNPSPCFSTRDVASQSTSLVFLTAPSERNTGHASKNAW
jgi:hypothetical protein